MRCAWATRQDLSLTNRYGRSNIIAFSSNHRGPLGHDQLVAKEYFVLVVGWIGNNPTFWVRSDRGVLWDGTAGQATALSSLLGFLLIPWIRQLVRVTAIP